MDLEKVNRLKNEIRSLSRDEFHHIRSLVDTIVIEANGNPNYWEKAKENDIAADIMRALFKAASK